MENFQKYLSTAPVIATVWFTFTAGLLIEINRFFPDPLVFSFFSNDPSSQKDYETNLRDHQPNQNCNSTCKRQHKEQTKKWLEIRLQL